MSNKNLQEILNNENKKVDESTNLLSKLFRTILRDLNVDYPSLNGSMNRYLERQQQQVLRSKKDTTREKGNLVKELTGDALTWKNFAKGMQVLNPVKIELTCRIFWNRGRTTEHTVGMNVRSNSEEED